jgi:hypothetical protein
MIWTVAEFAKIQPQRRTFEFLRIQLPKKFRLSYQSSLHRDKPGGGGLGSVFFLAVNRASTGAGPVESFRTRRYASGGN